MPAQGASLTGRLLWTSTHAAGQNRRVPREVVLLLPPSPEPPATAGSALLAAAAAALGCAPGALAEARLRRLSFDARPDVDDQTPASLARARVERQPAKPGLRQRIGRAAERGRRGGKERRSGGRRRLGGRGQQEHDLARHPPILSRGVR